MLVKELLDLICTYYVDCENRKFKIVFEEENQGEVIMRCDNEKALVPYNERHVDTFMVSGDLGKGHSSLYIDLL